MLLRLTYQRRMLRTGSRAEGEDHLIWMAAGNSAAYADRSNYCYGASEMGNEPSIGQASETETE